MVNQFGCRPVMLIGGLLASAGMILASFTTNIIELYLTAGVLTGESPGISGATQAYLGRAKTMLYFPLAPPCLASGHPSLFALAYGKNLVLNVAPVRDASAGSKQQEPAAERQKKPRWCSVIVVTVVGSINTEWQGKEAEFLCKAQVLPKCEPNYLIQTHFRWTGWFSQSPAGAIHQHEDTKACEEYIHPIMVLQD